MIINEAINQFLIYLRVEKKYSSLTIANYARALFMFNTWRDQLRTNPKPEHIEELDIETIRSYRLYLAEKQLSLTTQIFYINPLRSWLIYLIRNGYKTLESSRIEMPKMPDRTAKFLTKDQIDMLMNAIPTDTTKGKRDRAIIELLFSTGLRVSELVGLNRSDMNPDSREFTIIGKGGRARMIFISEQAYNYLYRYLSERKDSYPALFTATAHGGQDWRLSVRSIQVIVKEYADLAGLPSYVSPHVLRHSFATAIYRSSGDLRSVQELLGHKDIATTQIYTHTTNSLLRSFHQQHHPGNKT